MRLFSFLAFAILLISCKNANTGNESDKQMALLDPVQTQPVNGYKRAYFASGCFWCVEAIFESLKGVNEVISGYSGGTEQNPTYRQVSYGKTNHAEAVEVFYDPKVISYQTLVKVFFGSQDPTTLNRQGPDRGRQYRSIAFYQNAQEKEIIENTIKQLNKQAYDGEIVTQVLPFREFWKAEAYHQDYEEKNPGDPYIQGVSIPRYNRFKKQFPELLKDNAH
ncbi:MULTISPECIES: peptide-methionine (S)-S-oxide reductase MsrA [unclassified Leeuwenhoekiella]|uniref:peptide-methionine (S)-S-oxide reductase MsrA n=1 Tax=unclassified Leeuwenhoekiella TaxID=2615029 RepID=UPI0025BE8EC9|nr:MULTISPECIES: peptide-methionine (S)-S-oxide reductase MsrA [unclassified Leeuwenhoekiella]|tara:strand:- start:26788 stop:27450 length:663 start_codon:yes stop_codon:yes gene_type:complete